MRIRHLVCTCAVTLAAFAALPAVAAAVPPLYPNGWTFAMSGLRQIPTSVDTRAFCKGPVGTVYEVALGQTTAYHASIARIRVSDGKVIKSWTYPRTPGSGVIPRAAASDAAGNLYVAVETLAGKKNWVVLKFDRTGRRLWTRSYDSGLGSDVPYTLVIDHHGGVIVAGTSEHAGGYDAAIVKWSSAGRPRWKRMISARGLDLVSGLAVDARDNVYAAGQRGSVGGLATAILRSWTSGGRQRWTATAVNPLGMPSWRLVAVRGTSVYVAGQSSGTPSTSSLMAMKYTTAGKRAWGGIRQRTFTSGAWAEGLAVDRRGAPVIVGSAYGLGTAGENEGTVWKLTSGGTTAWHREFEDPDFPGDSEFRAVGVDSQNRIYAAGGKYYSGQTANLLMVRYSPAGSAQAMWRSDGQQSGYCSFTNVLVLSDTQVLAAGQVAGNGADAGVYRARTTMP
jgi:hypothetical protein